MDGEANSQGYYIYCIIRTDEGPSFDVASVDGDRSAVGTIGFMDLAAVTSPCDHPRYQVTRKYTLAHQLVLEGVMQQFTLLPVRFGTVAGSREDVIEKLLKRKFGEFHGLFNYVEGKVELGLKVMWRRDLLFQQILADYPLIRRLRDSLSTRPETESHLDRIQLGQMVERAIDTRRDEDATVLLAALRPLAVETRVNKTIMDNMVLNAAFLVPADEQRSFDARVNELDERYSGRMIFKYVGPVPPYNFVSVVVRWD